METLLSLCVGIGLSAACGFRVFVPLLVMSVASYSGHLNLASGFDWIGSYPALVTFSLATVCEIGGYYIPWVDNFLDTIAAPAAAVAGTIVTASFVTDVSPFLQWTLAAVAGGGAATLVQGSTMLARAASTFTTGGLGNPLFSTMELGGSVMASLLSLVAPVLTLALVLVFLAVVGRKLWRLRTHPTGTVA